MHQLLPVEPVQLGEAILQKKQLYFRHCPKGASDNFNK